MTQNKDIKYINKDFNSLKQSLVNYTKTYFPNTYNDFSPSAPGTLFMDMAAYVGDVLSFYIDNQIQENYIQFARQSNNLFELAYMFGYKPNVTGVSIVDIDFYQQLPAVLSGSGETIPDFNYALYINPNSVISPISNASGSIPFLVQDSIDFTVSSSLDPTEISVYQIAGSTPTFYLLKKTRKAISATINTTTFTFGNPQEFSTVLLNSNKIVGILDIFDSDGNEWKEVDYLAQETVYDSIKNVNTNDPNSYNNLDTPYLLKLKKVQRRFATRFIDSGSLQLQFGSGTNSQADEEIIPNSDNVGMGLPFEKSKMTTAYDPTNFMFDKTYGIAPSNTTLTVRYLTGGGVEANVSANSLISFSGTIKFLQTNLNATTANLIYSSLLTNNLLSANGGGNGDSIEDIRQNSIANFSTQLRNVTPSDYLVRALSMSPKYGDIAKAYIEPTKIGSLNLGEIPSILDLYILTYDVNKKLKASSNTLKQNLITYLKQYRIIGDSVRIKDAFIINIGVDFEIIVLPNFNSNEVLLNCVNILKSYFEIEKWQINQPIILRELFISLDKIPGVQTVKDITITNKAGVSLGYSPYGYDIDGATVNKVVYPSLDPSIFEVKNPSVDIRGKVSLL